MRRLVGLRRIRATVSAVKVITFGLCDFFFALVFQIAYFGFSFGAWYAFITPCIFDLVLIIAFDICDLQIQF